MTRSTRIGALACSVAVVCLMDPRLAAFGPASALVCLVIFLLALREGLGWNLLAPMTGVFAGAIAFVGYGTGADSYRYIANTVSLIQDRDFDLGNQFLQFLDIRLPHGPTGMALSAHPVGNAFIWVFPVLVAHLYALLTGHYALDFVSPPYLGAMIVTNLVVGLGGALALAPHAAA